MKYDRYRSFNIHNISIKYHISQAFSLLFFVFWEIAHSELSVRSLIQTVLYDILSLGTLGFSAQSVEIALYDKKSHSREESSYILIVLYFLDYYQVGLLVLKGG